MTLGTKTSAGTYFQSIKNGIVLHLCSQYLLDGKDLSSPVFVTWLRTLTDDEELKKKFSLR